MKAVKVIILVSMLLSNLIFSQIEHTINFDDFKFKINNYIAKDGNTYSLLESNSYYFSREEGKPNLPMKTIRFIIPNDKSVENIEILSTLEKESDISNIIYPVQSNSDKRKFIEPDKTVYDSEDPFPLLPIILLHEDIFDGYNKIATFAVYPIKYYAKKRKIDVIQSIRFRINLKDINSELAYPKKRSSLNRKLYSEILSNMVENPSDI